MARLGWTSLRPVQELASHAILDGHNCIVLAPTTVGNPEAILEWLHGNSQRPKSVIDPPKQPSAREIRIALHPLKKELAEAAAQAAQGQKSLFFCQSRALSEEVAQEMRVRGTDVFVHHSSVALEERQAAEERFHHGRDTVIVCTSTLELGIDVGDLDKVLQANAPSTRFLVPPAHGKNGPKSRHPRQHPLPLRLSTPGARTGWARSGPRQPER